MIQNREAISSHGAYASKSLNKTSTESLLLRIREGDSAAFDTLFNRYYMPVIHFIRCYVDESDIEDVAQEVFVNVFNKIDTLHTMKSFEGYLFRAAKNSAINWLKKRIRFREILKLMFYANNSWNINDTKNHSKKIDLTKQVLEQLHDSPRKIIEWFYLEKLSREEIAQRLQVSISTAYRRIAESRAELLELAERQHIEITFEGRHDFTINS